MLAARGGPWRAVSAWLPYCPFPSPCARLPLRERERGETSFCLLLFYPLILWMPQNILALKRGTEMLHSPTRNVVTINEMVPIEMRKESHQAVMLCWLSCFCPEFQHMVVLLVHGTAVAFVKPHQRWPRCCLDLGECVVTALLLSPQLCSKALEDGWTR